MYMLEFNNSGRGATTTETTKGAIADSARGLVIGCLGYGIFLSWVWIVYFSNFPLQYARMSVQHMSELRIVMLAVVIVVLPLLGRAESFFITRRGIASSAAASIVLCPLGAIASLVVPCSCTHVCSLSCMCPAMMVHSVAWGLSGAGYAFLMVYWVWFLLALYGVKQRNLAIVATMVVSAVMFFLMTLLQPVPSLIFFALMPVFSVALSIYSHKLLSLGDSSIAIRNEGIKPDEGRRMRLSRKTVAMTMFSGVLLGFCGFAITTNAFADKMDPLLSLLLIVASVVLFVFVKHRGSFDEDLLIRLYMPIGVFCLIPMSMIGGFPQAVLSCVLIALLTAYSFVDLHVFVCDMPFVLPHLTRVMAFGRMGNVAGLAIGWVAGLLFCTILFDGEEALQQICLVLVLVLVAWSTYMFRGPQHSAFPPMVERPEADYYEAQCRRFGELYGLTARQEEVLQLLGRGRTAKSIQEKLVISESTAKTHIYNIYQKAGVHTQQELIDKLDALEITIEDFA